MELIKMSSYILREENKINFRIICKFKISNLYR